jgi:predicted XRE-type DNA-binding protein
MTDDSTEIVRGSGNVFRDFGYPDADVRQAKALLSAQIIKVLDGEQLTTRQAEARTGIAHSEFVRIRNVNLARFTIDRLVMILGRLGQEVEFSFTVHPRTPRGAEPDRAHL